MPANRLEGPALEAAIRNGLLPAGIATTASKVRSKPLKTTEKQFTKEVIAYAMDNKWLVAHFRPAMTQRGRWVTAVQGDGAGFPDLLMIRGVFLVVAELKCGKNKPTDAQKRWLAAFGGLYTVEAHVWYPEDWDVIRRVLGEPPPGSRRSGEATGG